LYVWLLQMILYGGKSLQVGLENSGMPIFFSGLHGGRFLLKKIILNSIENLKKFQGTDRL